MFFMNSQHAFNYRVCRGTYETNQQVTRYIVSEPRIFHVMACSPSLEEDAEKLMDNEAIRHLVAAWCLLTKKRQVFDLMSALKVWNDQEFRVFVQALAIWRGEHM